MKKMKVFLMLGLLLLPGLAFAAGIVPADCQGENVAKNCDITDLLQLAYNIINYLLGIAGIAALLFVLWGGVQMVLSQGSPDGVKAGKATLYNALLGFLLVFCSFIIFNFVIGSLSNFRDFTDIIQFWRVSNNTPPT